MEVCDDNFQHLVVLQSVRSLHENYANNIPEQEKSDSDSNASDDEFPALKHARSSSPNNVASHLQDYKEFVKATSQHPPTSDLDWYLAEPVHPWDQDFNLLKIGGEMRVRSILYSRRWLVIFCLFQFMVCTSKNAYYRYEFRPFVDPLNSIRPHLTNALMHT
ncbi:hypothetical protein M9H77_36980 [Catharanthus roseus]|uniref:Uncharacterized protein n=1 Tax=Catharanthus roseus TaxID=4058 RepID=A0ACB9ZTR5_CATRO|nr:hypothetical protein M9H77_36980 [Catharanthus roseus]